MSDKPTIEQLKSVPVVYTDLECPHLRWYPWQGHLYYIDEGVVRRCSDGSTPEALEAMLEFQLGGMVALKNEDAR